MADESAFPAAEEKNISDGGMIPPSDTGESEESAPLQTKIAELEQSVNQFKDQLLRKAAEFENYKRRTENDYSAMVRFSTEEMIAKLLPILDDFERSMKISRSQDAPANPSGEEGSFYRGMEMIFSKFRKMLEQ